MVYSQTLNVFESTSDITSAWKKGKHFYIFLLAVLWSQIICCPCSTGGRPFDCFRYHLFLFSHDIAECL